MFPMTPSTLASQVVAEMIHNGVEGLEHTELINTESEHTSISALEGAALAGGRTITVTSSQGYAYMHDILGILPMKRLGGAQMFIANRAMSGNLNIHGDQSDTMLERDSGWIKVFTSNAQEIVDLGLIIRKTGEYAHLPTELNYSGFLVSHTGEPVDFPAYEQVRQYLGEYGPIFSPFKGDGVFSGPADLQNAYTEHRRQLAEIHKFVFPLFSRSCEEYYALTGRRYSAVRTIGLEDAKFVAVILSSAVGETLEAVVKANRARGVSVGMVSIALFRPFPYEQIGRILQKATSIAVIDQADTIGGEGGPLFTEVCSAVLNRTASGPCPALRSYILGLGGRNVRKGDLQYILDVTEFLARNWESPRAVQKERNRHVVLTEKFQSLLDELVQLRFCFGDPAQQQFLRRDPDEIFSSYRHRLQEAIIEGDLLQFLETKEFVGTRTSSKEEAKKFEFLKTFEEALRSICTSHQN